MYLKLLMTLKDNEIVPVAFVISEEKILAMRGINVFPIFQGKFYCGKRRVVVCLVCYSVRFQKILYYFYL